ncbi:hypothetical protein CPT_Sonora_059 [Stenotrophomonas phage Sonora]|nr:hypothetical protein CPT_Sonora_059 [Stenotrophomonas phage Sonora]
MGRARALAPRTHCRCRSCGARQVKAMPLEWYRTPPRCKGCRKRTLREDKWMNARDTRAQTCRCDGYVKPHFPHRRGSRFCKFRKDGTQRTLGDPDFQDQYMEWQKDHGEYKECESQELVPF